jgi:signal transduction histidine kinase
VRVKNRFLEIEVKDSGIGISEENQKKLFKLFGFLQESEMHNKNGVGLGLAISKQIVEQYEGSISVKSKIGMGSSFTFKFRIYP